jgi:hypothetical protein
MSTFGNSALNLDQILHKSPQSAKELIHIDYREENDSYYLFKE